MAELTDLLHDPGLRLALAPTGVDPSGRPVRWVTTSELPDPTPYLEGAELLLTTGLVAQDWSSWVQRVAAAGVAAVGFGVGVNHDEVPPDLLAASRRADLPVVVVPKPTPFLAVGKALAGLIAAAERAAAEATVRLQQQLTRAMTQPDGRERMVALLARAAGGRAVLVDRDGEPTAPVRSRPGPAAQRVLAGMREAGLRGAVTDSRPGATVVVQPVGIAHVHALLVLEVPGPPDEVVRAGLAAAVALLGLDAERRAAADAADLRLRDRATRLLLDGHTDAGRSVAALVAGAVLPDGPMRVVACRGGGPRLREDLARTRPELLTASPEPDLVLAVVPDGAATGAWRSEHARLGIGSPVAAADLPYGMTTAMAACDVADPGGPPVDWEQRSRSGVLAALTPAAAAAVRGRILGPLAGEPELVRTLRSHLVQLGRRGPTARELGIHRNTLDKRLHRIGRLTGLDVDSAAGRADLWIALCAEP